MAFEIIHTKSNPCPVRTSNQDQAAIDRQKFKTIKNKLHMKAWS